MAMNLTNRTLGDIAATIPASTRVFLRNRLDFCCKGQRSTLSEACRERGLEAAAIADEITREAHQHSELEVWAQRSNADLVSHIIEHFHAGLRRDVPPLIEAAARVERVHANKDAVPSGLAAHLDILWRELSAHMAKEETILFPLLLAPDSGRAAAPVRRMLEEHESHGRALERTRDLTGDLEAPANACATWRALYDGLENLEAQLMEHVHLENNILFLRALEAS